MDVLLAFKNRFLFQERKVKIPNIIFILSRLGILQAVYSIGLAPAVFGGQDWCGMIPILHVLYYVSTQQVNVRTIAFANWLRPHVVEHEKKRVSQCMYRGMGSVYTGCGNTRCSK